MVKTDFYSLLKYVPKAELHLHAEATVSNRTIKKLYKFTTGKTLTDYELKALFKYNDLAGFLVSFLKIQSYFGKIKDLHFICSDFDQYLRNNNIVYCETFFAPTGLMKKGFSFEDLLTAISGKIDNQKERDGRIVKILVDVSRSFGPDNAMNNLNLVLKSKNPHIIGIGLGGDEEKGPAKVYKDVFQKAKAEGLHRVAHAGETCDSWSIKDSIDLLSAERIGHGISAAYDESLMEELKQKQIPLELCPTSNTYTRHYFSNLSDHPIKKLYDAGLLVTVNTDDPTFFKVSLIDEYWNVFTKFNFSLDDIKQLILNSFKASFLDDEQKSKYCADVEKAWAEWFLAHPNAKK